MHFFAFAFFLIISVVLSTLNLIIIYPPFYWSPGVVLFDHRFFLVVILSIIMASAVFYRHTNSVLVLHFPDGTSAAFGADCLAALRPNGQLATGVLAAVDALLKHLACNTLTILT